jgi:hypothetical protein
VTTVAFKINQGKSIKYREIDIQGSDLMKENKKMPLTQVTAEMIDDILNSHMRSVEKLFLIIEWILREKIPCEFSQIDMKEFKDKAKSIIAGKISLNLFKRALKEAQEIFRTKDEQETFLTLLALSYYSYIDNEFLYDTVTRNELLLKLSDLGISPSRIKNLNNKWVRIAGSSKDLFNRIFEK